MLRTTSTFIIPTVVLHELSLGIPNNENNEETFNIIFKKIKLYFNENFKIDELSSESINGYKEIYEKTKMLSDNKYKHKIDALIVAHASKVSKLLSSKYNNFWLLTEDKKMRNNYKVNNLKIYLLDEALDELGIDKHRMLV